MSIRKLRAGRVPGVTAQQYIGTAGTIFWNEATGALRLSDGTTLGGVQLPINIASQTEFGGIKLGPGVILNNENQLIIDTSGLEFSFGHFNAIDNVIQTTNVNEDFNIVSNGDAVVNLVGELHIHTQAQWATSQDGAIAVMTVSEDGYVTIRTPNVPTGASGALNIVGSTDGSYMPVVGPGGMLHITGNPDTLVRVTIDGFLTAATGPQTALGAAAGYGTIAMRTARGTPTSPLPVQADDLIGNYSALGYVASSSRYSPGQVAGLQFFAAETFNSSTATGTYAQFRLAPIGSNAGVVAATIRSTGITAATFTGNLTGNVTGNITGTAPAGSLTGTTLASNVVTSSLTSVGTLGSLAVTGTTSLGHFTGRYARTVRDAGIIGDGGTVTIDFATDAIVYFTWANGVNLAYQNYTAGRIVKVIATKASGTGTDSLSLDGITAANVSTGSTTISGSADNSYFIELTCTGTTLGSVYAKV